MTPRKHLPVPPSYKILRFDENYSCLSNAVNRTDWFDPIKYIPLRTGEPDWYLTLGGELRERFEGVYDPNFGIGGNGPESYWLQRATWLGDLHLGDRVRFFAEGISGIIEGETQPAPPPQNDPVDLQFAFADVVPYLTDDERLTLRAGRFGLSLGAGRLVATRAAPNIPFRFDGLRNDLFPATVEGNRISYPPGRGQRRHFRQRSRHDVLGVVHHALVRCAAKELGVDLYYLGIANAKRVLRLGNRRRTPAFLWLAHLRHAGSLGLER